ncbi:MAG TPA: hypothetical protein VM029_03250 [Opitutaceae bacterium]|nr:hypothetical protein [Opitutaceae bacterium]
MRSRFATPVAIVLTLAVAGAGLNRLVSPAWTAMRARQPALQLDSTAAAAGQGVTLALLGGFRALVADGVWLRLYALWERQDLAATDAMIRLTTAIDARPVYFWLNGARILANDLPVWRIMMQGGFERVPQPEQRRIMEEQARSGLAHLAAAMKFHPASSDLWIERANIELNKLHDPLAAAASYRRAWEMPNGPFYAARLHAELLRRNGRRAEALAWLVQLHPQLPRGDEAAAADIVLERIRELEQQLGVAPERVYQPKP